MLGNGKEDKIVKYNVKCRRWKKYVVEYMTQTERPDFGQYWQIFSNKPSYIYYIRFGQVFVVLFILCRL